MELHPESNEHIYPTTRSQVLEGPEYKMESQEVNSTISSTEGDSQPSLRKFHDRIEKGIAALAQDAITPTPEPVQIPFRNNPEPTLFTKEIMDTTEGEDVSDSIRQNDDVFCSSLEYNPLDMENNSPMVSSPPNQEYEKCRHNIQSILQLIIIQIFQSVTIEMISTRNWPRLSVDEIIMKITEILSFSTFKYSLPHSTIKELIKEEMNPCPFNSLCSLLYTYFVEPIEEQFKIHIYLPIELLEKVLLEQIQRTVEEISSQVEPALLSNYQVQIQLKASEFLPEYRARNAAAENSKVEAQKLLFEGVIAGCEKETLSLLGDEYIDKEKEIDSVFAKFLQILLAGCVFGDLVKNQEMKDAFHNSVQQIREKILLRNEKNLENELLKYPKSAKRVYPVVGKDENENNGTHRRAIKSSRRQFDSTILNLNRKLPGNLVKQMESKLKFCLKSKRRFERKRRAAKFDFRKNEAVDRDDHNPDQLKPPNPNVPEKTKRSYLCPTSFTEYSREYQKEIEEVRTKTRYLHFGGKCDFMFKK